MSRLNVIFYKNRKMKKFLFFSIMILISSQISAQNLQLKGRVLSGKECIEFANVLLQTEDSVFVTGGITDQRGRFAFNNLEPGDYRLRVSSLGYTTRDMPLNSFAENKDLNDSSFASSPCQF